MTANQIKARIQERGYWEIVIRPKRAVENLIPNKAHLIELIKNNSLATRGWRYPFFSDRSDHSGGVHAIQNGIEDFIDWGQYKEIWRFDTSAQFIHYLALWEDWWNEDPDSRFVPDQVKRYPPMTALSSLGTIWTLTEILEFARKLSNQLDSVEALHIQITLHNTMDRKVATFDPMRRLFDDYVCRVPRVDFTPITVTKEDLQANSKKIALKMICEVFEMFNWRNMPVNVFEQDQDNLLSGRI